MNAKIDEDQNGDELEHDHVVLENGKSRVRYKIGDNEMEAEGSEAFVNAHTAAFLGDFAARLTITPMVDLGKDDTDKEGRSLLELRGLGKDIWRDSDAQDYVNSLRDEWDQ